MASQRRLKLTRMSQQQNLEAGVLGFKMVITASDGNMIANEVFRMRRRPINPHDPTGVQVDDFFGVCTMQDLVSLPITAPAAGDIYFRLAQITVVDNSQQEADDSWTKIKLDVDKLRESLDIADKLGPAEIYWSGTTPT